MQQINVQPLHIHQVDRLTSDILEKEVESEPQEKSLLSGSFLGPVSQIRIACDTIELILNEAMTATR
jgi:hypothetical protein